MPTKKATMYDNNECFNLVKKQTEEKKVNPNKVFQGYTAPKKKCPKGHKVCNCKKKSKGTVPKGSHRMPDGTIMKDSDMPKKKKTGKY